MENEPKIVREKNCLLSWKLSRERKQALIRGKEQVFTWAPQGMRQL